MRVRYSNSVLYTFLCLGGILLVAGTVLTFLSGGIQLSSLSGALLVGFVVLGANRLLLVLEGNELQARNVLGMTLRRHPVSELQVEADSKGNRRLVRVRSHGRPRPILRAKTLFLDRADTEDLINLFSARAFSE